MAPMFSGGWWGQLLVLAILCAIAASRFSYVFGFFRGYRRGAENRETTLTTLPKIGTPTVSLPPRVHAPRLVHDDEHAHRDHWGVGS